LRALAIDLWDKRCWIALEVQKVAIPKEIVSRQEIISVIDKYLIDYDDLWVIVVGLPYDLYWKDLKQLEKTKSFIKQLEKKYKDLKVIWIDERFTTFEAENVLNALWKKDQEWKKDAISASLILESYLNNN